MKNPKVVIYSIIAIICLVLMVIVDWIFIVPAAFIVFYNQKELFGKKKK